MTQRIIFFISLLKNPLSDLADDTVCNSADSFGGHMVLTDPG